MDAPLYMYFIVLAKLFLLGFALIGGVPILERFVDKDEEALGGVTRIVKKGSWRYVEYIGPNADPAIDTTADIQRNAEPEQTKAVVRQRPEVKYL